MRKYAFDIDKHAGMTLIEVLISMVVISIGLLGVAGLHLRTLQNNYVALMRSHASALVDDIADRMRSNRSAVTKDGVYDLATFAKPAPEGTARAAVDVQEWKAALAAQLPSGDGEIDIADTGVVTIRVRWGERADPNNNATTVSFVTQTVI